MGVPIATGAVKTMRTNVVGRGLMLKPTVDAEVLKLTAAQALTVRKRDNKGMGIVGRKPGLRHGKDR